MHILMKLVEIISKPKRVRFPWQSSNCELMMNCNIIEHFRHFIQVKKANSSGTSAHDLPQCTVFKLDIQSTLCE